MASAMKCVYLFCLILFLGSIYGSDGGEYFFKSFHGSLKTVLFARNLTLNSDVTPNYKYMFGPHGSPLTYQ